MIVRGPSCELAPSHNTIVPSTMEASDSEVRVAVSIPLLESVRTPRNAGLPSVTATFTLPVNIKVNLNEGP